MSKPNIEHHYGAFLIRHRNGSELVQTDWDYPSVASRYGWNPRRVQARIVIEDGTPRREIRDMQRAPNRGKGCAHRGTDGTVDCGCGVTASAFIQSAGRYLDGLC